MTIIVLPAERAPSRNLDQGGGQAVRKGDEVRWLAMSLGSTNIAIG